MRMLTNLKSFLDCELTFITVDESMYREELIHRGHQDKPLGRLVVDGQCVEIVFLHYASKDEAKEKWNRRIKRINYDHLIIKNSYQNGFSDDMIKDFENLPYENKICFVHKPSFTGKSIRYYKGYENCQELLNDTNDFKRYINLNELLNS